MNAQLKARRIALSVAAVAICVICTYRKNHDTPTPLFPKNILGCEASEFIVEAIFPVK